MFISLKSLRDKAEGVARGMEKIHFVSRTTMLLIKIQWGILHQSQAFLLNQLLIKVKQSNFDN